MTDLINSIPFGIYILDNKGNYIYANNAYLQSLGMKKQELLNMNVHDFLKNKEIDVCVSDIVYQTKRRHVALQDVNLKDGMSIRHIRHLIVSTPVFNAGGNVENIIAVCLQLSDLKNYFAEIGKEESFSTISKSISNSPGHRKIIAVSPVMRRLLDMVELIGKSDASVLITGETGTGKEVIAQYVHQCSKRADKKLVVINCASLPENLLEAELFGYEQGAFTGAQKGGKKGLIEEADGGTLFLDEINSFPIALQGKLLRVLETKMNRRVGSTTSKAVDFRLVAATNEDLNTAVANHTFRADLYYRLSVVPIQIPPLRERRQDILPLAQQFLSEYNEQYRLNKELADAMKDRMMAYSWPGNVRELRNVIERAVVISMDNYINIPDISGLMNETDIVYGETGLLNQEIRPLFDHIKEEINNEDKEPDALPDGMSLTEYLESCEKKYLSRLLSSGKSTYEAAKILGISQSAVMRRKKKYGI